MPRPAPGPGSDPGEPLDPERFEALRPGLELLALRALGDIDAAREAAQETLTRATVAWSRGATTGAGRLAAFVAGIARHVVTDIRRARHRAPTLDVDVLRLPAEGPDPLELLVSDDERTDVRRAIRRLPASDQELLRLCFYEGLSPSEVALRLGEPPERIRKRKSRALERLREAFRQGPGHVDDVPATEEGKE